MFFLLFLAFGFRFSSKILMGFSDLVSDVVFGFFYLDSGSSSIWAAIFRLHGSLIAAKPILLHLSPLYRIYKGFDNQNVKICRFCVRFSVLIDIFWFFLFCLFFFCFLLFCDFGIFSSTVLRFLIDPNAPLIEEISDVNHHSVPYCCALCKQGYYIIIALMFTKILR